MDLNGPTAYHFEPFNFDLKQAVNGKVALEIFQQWHPDLIFMDVRMPVMDGMETTRKIRSSKDGTTTKIIAVTAHAMEEERIEILSSGCDDFIRKPYRESDITYILEKYLGVHFIYKEEEKALIPSKESLEPYLKQLPHELLLKLHENAILLNKRTTLEVVDQISNINNSVGEMLRNLVIKRKFQELQDISNKLIASR